MQSQTRFNRVKKVPKKVWVQSQVKFCRVPKKVPEKVLQSQVRFNSVPKKVPRKVWKAVVQSHVRFNRFAKDPGSLGAKPRRIQPVPDKVPEKVPRFREALVLSQVKFNRIPEKVPVRSSGRCLCRVRFNSVSEKVPKKVPGSLGAKPSQVQWVPEKVVEKVPEKVLGNLWCRARSRSNSTSSTGFPALGFAATYRRICKNKMLLQLGISPKLIWPQLWNPWVGLAWIGKHNRLSWRKTVTKIVSFVGM